MELTRVWITTLLLVFFDTTKAQVLNLELKHTSQGFYQFQRPIIKKQSWLANETAIIVVDMWNQHPCLSAELRVTELADRINKFLPKMRKKGIKIIHAPGETQNFYKNSPEHQRILASLSQLPFPFDWINQEEHEPSMPLPDGCEEGERKNIHWWRQHPAIALSSEDVVSSDAQEIFNYLKTHRIKNLLYVGVHSNICLSGMTYGLRSFKAQGFQVAMIADLTDSYTINYPGQKLNHEQRNQIIINHVSTYLAPTVSSDQL